MASTQIGTNHPGVPKFWSRKLFVEALKETYVYKFTGTTADSLLQVKNETAKGPGDKITYQLRMQLGNPGISGDNTLDGNEEQLVLYTDSIVINQLRNAVKSDGRMTDQRAIFNIRDEGRSALQDWFSNAVDTGFFNQICGNTAQADTRYTGLNAAIAPDTNHIVYPNLTTTEAEVASASASNKMKLSYIDNLVERARTLSPLIRPIKINGENYYVLFMHPYQFTDLKADTSTGGWLDIQKAAMTGGKISDNPIFTGAEGVYNNVILHVSTRIPTVTAGVYRAAFCGAQSAVMAFGQANSDQNMTWVEETKDYENQMGIAAGMIFGIKKCQFNSSDFGTLILPTYAAQH